MTEWTRATVAGLCGRCGGQVHVGEPVEVHRLARVRRLLRRCVLCADTTPPDDLPDLVRPAAVAEGPVRWTPRRRAQPADVRARQANDDQ
jgi:hypothetical protein